MKANVIICILFCLFNLVIAYFPPPSDDDFYTPPEGIENQPNGAILKMRHAPAPLNVFNNDVNLKNYWQILVKSEDTFGEPTAAVASLFEPYNADRKKLVVYEPIDNSANVDCSPSYFFFGFNNTQGTQSANVVVFTIETILQEGYYVMSPDYEGLKAGFGSGSLAGHITLDSVRAVLNSSNRTRLEPDARTILWGYSGGSIAAGWAGALQPTYAPELIENIKGIVLGGFVTNLTATAIGADGTSLSGVTAFAMAGLTNVFHDLKAFFKEHIYASKYDEFLKLFDICKPEASHYDNYSYLSGPDKYFPEGEQVFNEEPLSKILYDNTFGINSSLVPEIPLFIHQGKLDELAPIGEVERVYDAWCSSGIKSLEFSVSETTGHTTELVGGSGAAFAWMKNRITDEEPAVWGCERSDRLSNAFYWGAHNILFSGIQSIFDNMFGTEVGPNGENVELSKLLTVMG